MKTNHIPGKYKSSLQKLDKRTINLLEEYAIKEKLLSESYLKQVGNKISAHALSFKFLQECFKLASVDPQKRFKHEKRFLNKKVMLERLMTGFEVQASHGQLQGLQLLAYLATESVRRLNDWAETYPNYTSHLAKTLNQWPVLVTTKSARDEKLKMLLQDIRLDEEFTMGIPSATLRLVPAESKKWALKLFQAILSARFGQEERNEERRVMHQNWYWYTENVLLILKLRQRKSLLLRAIELEPIADESLKAWWELAKEILRLTIKHRPKLVEKLISVYGNTTKVQSMRSNRKKVKSLEVDEIVEEVRKSFFDLAKNYQPFRLSYTTPPPYVVTLLATRQIAKAEFLLKKKSTTKSPKI